MHDDNVEKHNLQDYISPSIIKKFTLTNRRYTNILSFIIQDLTDKNKTKMLAIYSGNAVVISVETKRFSVDYDELRVIIMVCRYTAQYTPNYILYEYDYNVHNLMHYAS